MKSLKGLFIVACGLIGLVSTSHAGTESFRQSCHVRYETRQRVQADCLDTRGNWVYNDYVKRPCAGDVANIDGRIVCTSGGGYPPPPGGGYPPPPDGRLPYGSYQQTCTSCYVTGSTLSCSCLDQYNRYRNTSIQYRQCRGDIANINGRLRCN